MPPSTDFSIYVQDQLTDFGPIVMKRMFGGVGIFREGLMFALIAGDTLRFKVNKYNASTFEAKGFLSPQKSKTKRVPYWEVPVEILEDTDELVQWAHRSYEIAVAESR